MESLELFLADCQHQVDTKLDQLLPSEADSPARLYQALRYSCLAPGKRIRPALTLATAAAFSGTMDSRRESECAIYPACAIELIHTYSLIHDDLPAMDDDDLRRGIPTCHKAFDEATAILAGDALQSFAFEILSQADLINVQSRLEMINTLAIASGARGMVAGQAIDLAAVGKVLTLEALEVMHLYKTGALIEASVVMGALAANQHDPEVLGHLRSFARSIGLAFQVQDDILDVESSTETLGKRQGSDLANNKPTYTSLLGLTGAKDKRDQLLNLATQALRNLPNTDTRRLQQLSEYIISRNK
ncbi:geranyltranstransferase [Oleiphilus messinensis]|uniref:Geranyltranstransferase n=1 Tax=Oleiphilus messinensis TaxID=141451 RepID=A0A1Y0IH17_9GAMM|nr:farnesyl diphosphate synthase [Oleiphilus messinensis]ARU58674.1 geranyltranstransferase [Oleiphilus messinensis]